MRVVTSAFFIAFSLLSSAVKVHSYVTFTGHSKEQDLIVKASPEPLVFTENRGQFGQKTLFRADAGSVAFYFCQGEVACLLTQDTNQLIEDGFEGMSIPEHFRRPRYKKESLIVRTQFLGANPNADVIGSNRLPYNNNYFLGNDPDKWYTDVPNYSEIVYKDIYPGINLKYYGSSGSMKYDFIIHPGADPLQIMIRYEGVSDLRLTDKGDLEIETAFGQLHEKSPQIYQEIDGKRLQVSGRYEIREPGVLGFAIEQYYDPSFPLIIDPLYEYGAFLGGINLDEGMGVAVDGSGAAYIVGRTLSADFPMENPYHDDYGGNGDLFVTKISPSGNSIIYSTFIGGRSLDLGNDIAVDSHGHAYITGGTRSLDFPTVNPFDADYNGGGFNGDAFVAKLSASGNTLLYSTYLGGSDNDGAWDIVLDDDYNIYITGVTYSPDFPLANPLDTQLDGNSDAFVSKLSAAGDLLSYSTFLGGSRGDVGWNITVDTDGSAIIGGWTASSDFPMVNAYYENHGGARDAFIAKLAASGDSIIFSTYMGAGADEGVFAIDIDNIGNIYVAGPTASTYFPTVNAYDDTKNGQEDAFIAKLSPSGDSIFYSTFYGGVLDDMAWGIAVDSVGNAYITGYTASADLPLVQPFDASYNWYGDAFVAALSASGQSLLYGTYLGGEEWDEGHDIAINDFGKIYVTGKTVSRGFPALYGYDESFNGDMDGFLVKFIEDSTTYLSVWPGDLDNNGIVQAEDLLPLVQYWHETGPDRGISDYGWYGHEARQWDTPVLTYVDADGSGRVDISDFFAICLNWAFTHTVADFTYSYDDDFDVQANREILELIYDQVRYSQSGPQFEIKRFIEELLGISVPGKFILQQSYPNPFNASVSIAYEVPAESRVTIEIYNIIGQRVRVLVDNAHYPGAYNIMWDGKDELGNEASSGIYLYRLGTSEYSLIRKMVLLK